MVYKYLFQEGVLVAKKDTYAPQHSEEINIPNLEVLAILKSFKSKGYVKETFNWQYYYCYLTNEGIDYLRQYLALPEDIVPATLKKTNVTGIRPGTEERKKGPVGEFNPEFKGKSRSDGYRREGAN